MKTDIQAVPEPVQTEQIGGFTAEMRAGEIVVNLPSDVLFDSGRDSSEVFREVLIERSRLGTQQPVPGEVDSTDRFHGH